MNNNVNEDDSVLEQGEGDDGENSNNNVTVSLQSPATQANTNTSFNTIVYSEKLFEDSRNNDNVEAKNNSKKRKGANCVPKLIDNKRKNMERQLSASQRDQLILNESKEDAQFKKDLATAMQKSNEIFEKSMN